MYSCLHHSNLLCLHLHQAEVRAAGRSYSCMVVEGVMRQKGGGGRGEEEWRGGGKGEGA